MDYFCATCQKRHPAEDIAADMWNICKEDIKRGLTMVTDRMFAAFAGNDKNQTMAADLNDNLLGFINQSDAELEKKLRSVFALDRAGMAQLQDRKKSGRLVTGTYVVKLDKLYKMYVQFAAMKDVNMINYFNAPGLQKWFDETVCSLDVRVLLDENGFFTAITDLENGHFEKNGIKLGFRRICSHCGRVLSAVAGCAEEIVLALSGSPRAGKTSCMVAMIHSLDEGRCHGVTIESLDDDETMKLIGKELDEFYRKGKKIIKTPTDEKEEVPTYSMLLKLKQRSGGDEDTNTETKRVLTITDMPGEFWKSKDGGLTEEFFKKYSGLYMNIDCIWFVTSKASVRLSQSNDIPEDEKKRLLEQTSESSDEMADPSNLAANLNRLKQHMEANGKRIPPSLVIISKPDYIVSEGDRAATSEFSLFPLSGDVGTKNTNEIKSAVRRKTDVPFMGIREKHMFNHSKNVRDYIRKCDLRFLDAVENNCPDRFYMSLAAYGQAPLERNTPESKIPTPYHEMYPLFWTLMITGATRVYHNVQWQTTGFLGGVTTEDGEEGLRYRYDKVDMLVANAKSRQRRSDLEVMYKDIENNLLTHRDTYSESVINHRRG